MKPLKPRTAEEAYEHHKYTPVRDYTQDQHAPRIARSREVCLEALNGRPMSRVIELGCGTADISGFLSEQGHFSTGYESSFQAFMKALDRWPRLIAVNCDIQRQPPRSCDLLILCEILEHVEDPEKLCASWMPFAEQCVMSSPEEGDLDGDHSAGDHQWSFTRQDFERFVAAGGHEVVKSENLRIGSYNFMIFRTRRKA
jgi:Methyltransferase domain